MFIDNWHALYVSKIETHLGGGSVMRKKRPAKRNIGIEAHPDVINKWKETEQIETAKKKIIDKLLLLYKRSKVT